jgi:hypothetical protein
MLEYHGFADLYGQKMPDIIESGGFRVGLFHQLTKRRSREWLLREKATDV